MSEVIPTARPTVRAAEEILNLYFPVLDHGFVALVDYMGGDEDIARAARVSFGGGSNRARTGDETRALLRYMHRHKHTSPFEMCELKFHCSMPIFVARQWIRHRTANVSEMSGRYSLMPMLFYTPPADQLRPQSKTNKQGRDGAMFGGEVISEAYTRWAAQRTDAVDNYDWLCGQDFARELARIDLPLSTYTQWYWKIDLHNLLHFLTLRVDAHAQWEIQQFGKVMAGMLKRVAPLSYEAWVDYDVCGARLSRMEMEALRYVVTKDPAMGLHTTSGNISKAGLLDIFQLSEREADEFLALFDLHPGIGQPWPKRTVPDFELDLAQAKSATYFEEQARAAVSVK